MADDDQQKRVRESKEPPSGNEEEQETPAVDSTGVATEPQDDMPLGATTINGSLAQWIGHEDNQVEEDDEWEQVKLMCEAQALINSGRGMQMLTQLSDNYNNEPPDPGFLLGGWNNQLVILHSIKTCRQAKSQWKGQMVICVGDNGPEGLPATATIPINKDIIAKSIEVTHTATLNEIKRATTNDPIVPKARATATSRKVSNLVRLPNNLLMKVLLTADPTKQPVAFIHQLANTIKPWSKLKRKGSSGTQLDHPKLIEAIEHSLCAMVTAKHNSNHEETGCHQTQLQLALTAEMPDNNGKLWLQRHLSSMKLAGPEARKRKAVTIVIDDEETNTKRQAKQPPPTDQGLDQEGHTASTTPEAAAPPNLAASALAEGQAFNQGTTSNNTPQTGAAAQNWGPTFNQAGGSSMPNQSCSHPHAGMHQNWGPTFNQAGGSSMPIHTHTANGSAWQQQPPADPFFGSNPYANQPAPTAAPPQAGPPLAQPQTLSFIGANKVTTFWGINIPALCGWSGIMNNQDPFTAGLPRFLPEMSQLSSSDANSLFGVHMGELKSRQPRQFFNFEFPLTAAKQLSKLKLGIEDPLAQWHHGLGPGIAMLRDRNSITASNQLFQRMDDFQGSGLTLGRLDDKKLEALTPTIPPTFLDCLTFLERWHSILTSNLTLLCNLAELAQATHVESMNRIGGTFTQHADLWCFEHGPGILWQLVICSK